MFLMSTKNFEGNKKNRTLLSAFGSAIITCILFLIHGELEIIFRDIAKRTYYTKPLYFLELSHTIVGAILLRTIIAHERKNGHKGHVEVDRLALCASCVFLLFGLFDWVFAKKILLTNSLYNVITFCALFCIIRRKKEDVC